MKFKVTRVSDISISYDIEFQSLQQMMLWLDELRKPENKFPKSLEPVELIIGYSNHGHPTITILDQYL